MPRPIEATHPSSTPSPHNLGARARRRRTRASGPSSRPTPTATASSASSTACAAPTASRCSTSPRPSACARSAGAARSCCSKAASRRATSSCARACDLWHVGALRRADRLAGRAQDARAAPRLPEDEQRHEPARLRARALPRRVAAARRAAAGRRDLADDALRRRRRRRAASRHQLAAFEAATRDLPGERSSPTAPPRCATARAWRPAARRLGAPRHHALRHAPDYPQHSAATGSCAGDDAAHAADRRAGRCGRRHRRLRQRASPPTAPMRIGVVACGYADGYPRHRARTRHAGAGRRRAHAHRRPRLDGHDHGRPRRRCRTAASAARSTLWGRAAERRGAADRRGRAGRPARSATS